MTATDQALAIVTGTSSGIGEAVATQLLEQGWQVFGISRRPGRLSAANFHPVALDLAVVSGLAEAFEATLGEVVSNPEVRRVGLVNNAADVALLGQLHQVAPSAMLSAYATNTVAPVVLTGWVLRKAPARAAIRIVNVSSGAAVNAFPGLGAYGATKAGLRLAGMVLAAELDFQEAAGAPARDVTLWSFDPGVVATPMQAAVRSSKAETVPIVQAFKDMHAGGQLRDTAEPAAEIVSYLNGDGHPRFTDQSNAM